MHLVCITMHYNCNEMSDTKMLFLCTKIYWKHSWLLLYVFIFAAVNYEVRLNELTVSCKVLNFYTCEHK